MLTIEDEPTIKHAIIRRLDKERGVKIYDTVVSGHHDCIKVGVLLGVDNRLILKSIFDLPPEFELGHVHSEVDEIAEQVKKARTDSIIRTDLERTPEVKMSGTGLRGRWERYG